MPKIIKFMINNIK